MLSCKTSDPDQWENKLFTHRGKTECQAQCQLFKKTTWSRSVILSLIDVSFSCRYFLSKRWSTLPRPLEICKSQAKFTCETWRQTLVALLVPACWYCSDGSMRYLATRDQHRHGCLFCQLLSDVVSCLAPRGQRCRNYIELNSRASAWTDMKQILLYSIYIYYIVVCIAFISFYISLYLFISF